MELRPQSRPRTGRFTRFVAITLIVLLMPFFALGTAIAATGTVTVQVHERGPDGVRLYIPVPALLADVAVALAPLVIPADELAEMRREIAPYREGLEALAAELEDMPSGVLADITSGGEHVRVTKTWRSFEIDVESDDAEIHIAVPARLLSRALDVL